MAASGGSWKGGSFAAANVDRRKPGLSGIARDHAAGRIAKRLNVTANPQGRSSRDELERTAQWVNRQRGWRATVDSEGRIKVGSTSGDQRRGTNYENAYYAIHGVLGGER